jgi:hypothetical protein
MQRCTVLSVPVSGASLSHVSVSGTGWVASCTASDSAMALVLVGKV